MIANRLATALKIAVALAALVASVPAAAREKNLGHFGTWQAFAQYEGGQTVCYMVTTRMVTAAKMKRATPYVMITHRPVEASTDVFSYGAGLALDTRHDVMLHVGAASFPLFAVGDSAWARDPQTDHKLAAALRASHTVRIKAYAARKDRPAVADTFDLTGADQAYRAIGKACGLPAFMPRKIHKKQIIARKHHK